MSKPKPILFKGAMVRAIMSGQKTQTRRIHDKPKYAVGDVLWVRETFRECSETGSDWFEYRADGDREGAKWKPSIFMPMVACRNFLRVTRVWSEPLTEISTEDAKAEGIAPIKMHWKNYIDGGVCCWPKYSFRTLWDSINGKREGCSWDDNPEVWCYQFEACDKPEVNHE